ncbi:hypothetical protein EMPS_04387 [Entomortierella parvispora]|uniref:Uncharacterized protein n=1 Tax=Entomortierella parvispora TaxID=205924 RepID=A0A9P3H8G8_9FUNG|nr:hypothetical protein EMPS_04387 [Entomortierella parvispora]
MTDPMHLRNKRPENATSILTSAIAANINIQLSLLHPTQRTSTNYHSLDRAVPTYPLFLATSIKAVCPPPGGWFKRSESSLQRAAATPPAPSHGRTWPFSTHWMNSDSPRIFFSPWSSFPRRNAYGRELSRMETLYFDTQDKKDDTFAVAAGLPDGVLDAILDPEESDISAMTKNWFDDQRLVFVAHQTTTYSGAERNHVLDRREPGWKLSETKKAGAATAASTAATRAQYVSPQTFLTSTQFPEDMANGSTHSQSFHSSMSTSCLQGMMQHLFSSPTLPSCKPICISGDESNVASLPSFIISPRSDLHRRPCPLPIQPPTGTSIIRCPSSSGALQNAVSLGPETQSWNEKDSDSGSNDSDDEDDDATITVEDHEEGSLHRGDIKSPKTTSTADSLEHLLEYIKTKMHNAEQTSKLELVIEQLLQSLSSQIRCEGSPFFWAWP